MIFDANGRGWGLYQFPPSFVLGFHGCDASVGEAILRGEQQHLKSSKNAYDWLGHGIYFWESNPQRAFEFAEERAKGSPNSKGFIEDPFVIGAIINLGYCLDTSNSSALEEVESAYEDFLLTLGENEPPPINKKDLKLRLLDCAVFNFLHKKRSFIEARHYDSLRATYREGVALYPGTDLSHQDHTQICVRNAASILGYFRPIKESD